jgi:hypothetical protein
MKKESLLERIMKAIKGGDEAKVSRFVAKQEKYLTGQINKKFEVIENLEEKIGDQRETLNDIIEHIDVHSLQNTESIEDYCRIYTMKVQAQLEKIEAMEEQVTDVTKQIEILRKIKTLTIGE